AGSRPTDAPEAPPKAYPGGRVGTRAAVGDGLRGAPTHPTNRILAVPPGSGLRGRDPAVSVRALQPRRETLTAGRKTAPQTDGLLQRKPHHRSEEHTSELQSRFD